MAPLSMLIGMLTILPVTVFAALTPGPPFVRLDKNDAVRILPPQPTPSHRPLTLTLDGHRRRPASRPLPSRMSSPFLPSHPNPPPQQ